MFWTKGLLSNGQGALIQRLCLHNIARISLEHSQVEEIGGDIRMFWTKGLLSNGQSTPI
jgi:hypothetical protein